MPAYLASNATFWRGGSPAPDAVRDLQHDLRALGYHRGGITGVWGDGLDAAVKSLRWDLVFSDGPSAIRAHNANGAVTGDPAEGPASVEPALGACIAALAADPAIVKLPASPAPGDDNRAAWRAVGGIDNGVAPTPYMLSIFEQESGGRHYHVPGPGDVDGFVSIGLDRNDTSAPDRITSRGYGIAQATLFHHPPTIAELQSVILSPARNVQAGYQALRSKLETCVCVSGAPSGGADDRHAEHPIRPLVECVYPQGDARRLTDCRACARRATKVNICAGDAVYEGAALKMKPTQYYPSATYTGVPDRADFPCDWPYAVRRYNGAGVNSYHYQARILLNLVNLN